MALVTVSEIKILGRIDYDEADSLLESLIEEATEFIEEYCEIKLSNITYIEERADGGGINL
ncbi:phage head-tail connector protein, partial [Candidatus Pacearchaeota archaeon]|nr:phage head-tail connector protein [Candidatus Pacearchaeota archaeon]